MLFFGPFKEIDQIPDPWLGLFRESRSQRYMFGECEYGLCCHLLIHGVTKGIEQLLALENACSVTLPGPTDAGPVITKRENECKAAARDTGEVGLITETSSHQDREDGQVL